MRPLAEAPGEVTPQRLPSEPRRVHVRWAAAALITGLLLTAAATALTNRDRNLQRAQELDRLTLAARIAIQERLVEYSEALFGLRGFLTSARPVSRRQFHDYVQLLLSADRIPGSRALSFITALDRREAATFTASINADPTLRALGASGFSIHPGGKGDELFVVTYVEPLAGNEPALGRDLAADPIRLSAIATARDTGEAIATGNVELAQGGRGIIMFLALYDRDTIPVTAPARRRAFTGLVNAVFRIDEMMSGVLGPAPDVDVEIHDVGRVVEAQVAPATDSLLFDTDRTRLLSRAKGGDVRSLDLHVLDRRWRILTAPSAGATARSGVLLIWIVALVGAAASLMFAALIRSAGRRYGLAVELATDMTANLRASEFQLQEVNQSLESSNTNLEELAAKLTESDRIRTAFLATISHDLRTPLFAIGGFAELLRDRFDQLDATDRKDYLARIFRNTESMRALLDELLEFSRMEQGDFTLNLRPIDLADLAKGVADQLSPLLAAHQVAIDVEAPVFALADAGATTRILANLLSNAAKYSPAGSHIRVCIDAEGDHAVIRVLDEGPGVPTQESIRIFEPFVRGAEAHHIAKGTGIGLAITRSLVQQMSGSIHLEENDRPGATFRVELPQAHANGSTETDW